MKSEEQILQKARMAELEIRDVLRRFCEAAEIPLGIVGLDIVLHAPGTAKGRQTFLRRVEIEMYLNEE